MAATLTLIMTSPNTICYLYNDDGAAAPNVDKTQAELIADAKTAIAIGGIAQQGGHSALAAFLEGPNVPDWTGMAMVPDLSLTITPIALDATGTAIRGTFTINPNVLTISGLAGKVNSAAVQLRYHPTPSR